MSPNEFREALQLADALAEFANLEPADAPAFRQEHPNFAPEWWAGDLIDVEHAGAVTPIWRASRPAYATYGAQASLPCPSFS